MSGLFMSLANQRIGLMVVWFASSLFVVIAGWFRYHDDDRFDLLSIGAAMLLASPMFTL